MRENNWIKVVNEDDLPKETGYYWFRWGFNTNFAQRIGIKRVQDLDSIERRCINHYKHIERPKFTPTDRVYSDNFKHKNIECKLNRIIKDCSIFNNTKGGCENCGHFIKIN